MRQGRPFQHARLPTHSNQQTSFGPPPPPQTHIHPTPTTQHHPTPPHAGGHGVDTPMHAATMTLGTPGVLHGSYSLLIQDEEGQVVDPHSISAG